MKLNDLMTNNLKDLLEKTNVVSVKPITDSEGTIIKIIVEYTPTTNK